MNLIITGRNFEVSDSIRDYATKKLSKLSKYFHQLIDMHVWLLIERQDHIAEITVNGDGVQFYAKEKAGDMYSAIDLLLDKIEQQIVRYKERHSGHKVTPLSELEDIATFTVKGEQSSITVRQVSNKPVDEKEAYLQMKLDNADFTLFKKDEKKVKDTIDYMNKNYAVIYKDGDGYSMVEIPFEMIQSNSFDTSKFNEYTLEIKNDSSVNPDIKLKKKKSCGVKMMTINDAVAEIAKNNASFVVFFNTETNYLNIIYKRGKNLELLVPAF
ncbi:MAG: ribosome-associated translation inhibitor RaiA [Spirochaetes bacterium]|nr:ribosome-associated translation inhibitor RaiA [Spirochaetota bacterium]